MSERSLSTEVVMTTRHFAMMIGLVYVAIGLLGFFPGVVSVPPLGAPDVAVETGYGYLLGLFPINILHNVVHLAVGAWGMTASRTLAGSLSFARGLAIFYGVLTVMGLIPGLNTTFGLIPLFSHDIWLHAVTAGVAAYFGFTDHAEAIPLEHLSRRAS
jgi:hypothetical protein